MQTDKSTFYAQVSNLKKLIQLLRRNLKYDVVDYKPFIRLQKDVFRQYPRNDIVDENVRILWQLLEESYFRPVTASELQCLNYVEGNFRKFRLDKNQETKKNKFDEDLSSVFQESYIQANFCKCEQGKNGENWVNEMFSIWKKQEQKNVSLQEAEKTRELGSLSSSSRSHSSTTQTILSSSDKKQVEKLAKFAKIEWKETVQQAKPCLEVIRSAVLKDLDWSLLLAQQTSPATTQYIQRPFDHVSMVRQQLAFIRYQIPLLEKKQVADSMLKLHKRQKNENQELFYYIQFEKGLNLPRKVLSQHEFQELNSLRQYSILKAYLTGSKSRFNYTSPNFYQFHKICNKQNKNQPELLNATQGHAEIASEFERLQMCHQCRYLYQPHLLSKCSLNSSSEPKNFSLKVYHPYIESVVKSQGFSLDEKLKFYQKINMLNQFQRYTCQNHKYKCDRYFCKSCLKNYNIPTKPSNLCPYCQGLCHCIRCTRRDHIFYLKRYLTTLEHDSLYKELFMIQNRKEEKIDNSKTLNVINKAAEELERIQALAVLLKKREMLKHKILRVKKDIFIKSALLNTVRSSCYKPLIV